LWLYSNKQKGLSLIELVISLSLSLFVVLGIVAFTAHFEKRKNTIINKIELEQNIQAIMHVISGQLRNVGYVTGGLSTKAQVSDAGMMTAIPNCLIFKYDRDEDGQLLYFGYALDANVIYQYTPSVIAPIADCTNLDGWEPMNDPSIIKVTVFNPVMQVYADPIGSKQYVRKVDLSIDAELAQVVDIKRNFTQSICILNSTVSM